MAKEKDDGAGRDPESKGEINERWQEMAEISSRYAEAKKKLPDDPRDLQIPTESLETRQVFGDVLRAGWSSSDAD